MFRKAFNYNRNYAPGQGKDERPAAPWLVAIIIAGIFLGGGATLILYNMTAVDLDYMVLVFAAAALISLAVTRFTLHHRQLGERVFLSVAGIAPLSLASLLLINWLPLQKGSRQCYALPGTANAVLTEAQLQIGYLEADIDEPLLKRFPRLRRFDIRRAIGSENMADFWEDGGRVGRLCLTLRKGNLGYYIVTNHSIDKEYGAPMP